MTIAENGGGTNMFNFYKIKMKIYSLILSDLCITLINSWRDDSFGWEYGRHYLKNKKSYITFWIANGRWFFNIEVDGNHNGSSPIGLFERHILWHEFLKQVLRNRISIKRKFFMKN